MSSEPDFLDWFAPNWNMSIKRSFRFNNKILYLPNISISLWCMCQQYVLTRGFFAWFQPLGNSHSPAKESDSESIHSAPGTNSDSGRGSNEDADSGDRPLHHHQQQLHHQLHQHLQQQQQQQQHREGVYCKDLYLTVGLCPPFHHCW